MAILSQDILRAHPRAKLIPPYVFESDCENSAWTLPPIDDKYLLLIEEGNTSDKIYDLIADYDLNDPIWGREKIWLLIALTYLGFDENTLTGIGEALEIGGKDIQKLLMRYFVIRHRFEDAKRFIENMDLSLEDKINIFIRASSANAFNIIQDLETTTPQEEFQELIKAGDYRAFREASLEGHLDILIYMEKKSQSNLQEMIKPNFYAAFWGAALFGHLEIIKYFEEKVKSEIETMISTGFNQRFYSSVFDHDEIAFHLLAYPDIFDYARKHSLLYPLIQKKISRIEERKTAFEADNPIAMFDVKEEQVFELYRCLQYLIVLNQPVLCDDIIFLLDIPGVKAEAYSKRSVLYRLVLTNKNLEAADILMSRFYIRKLFRMKDEEFLALTLTNEEKKDYQALIEHYEPLRKKRGVANLIDELRETLKKKYDAMPASIDVEKTSGEKRKKIKMALPCGKEDFEKLDLTEEEQQAANTAYYQNIYHTALRYLSKPHLESKGIPLAFEEHQPLISLLFLAVIDEDAKPTEGYTIERRLECFVEALAFIGRMNNKTLFKTSLNQKQYYHDDSERDKPGCGSNVKRYLLHSIQGHPDVSHLRKKENKRRNSLFKESSDKKQESSGFYHYR